MPNEVADKGQTDEPVRYKGLVVAYLVILLLLPLFWKAKGWPLDLFSFPYVVAWGGALGASVQMANGVMRHTQDWNGAFDFWYVIGPFIGIATGVITYAVIVAGLATFGGSAHGSVWGYIVAAFITGSNYRQFNRLIQKAGNALFGTPDDPPGKHT